MTFTTPVPFQARPGDTVDDEGFRIITSACTLCSHVNQAAALWPHRWPFASGVSALVDEDGQILLTRDGKGDRLYFDHERASMATVPVYMNDGRHVAWIRFLGPDGEYGFFRRIESDTVSSFHHLTTGLVNLGCAFMI